ncbi:MAG: ABC transporter ATP-binding protein [Candidatus Hodarchaeales archaeon]
MNIIEIEDLTKRFNKIVALNKISLKIKRGEVFGLLGPNGSGKTTLIRCLLGLLRPTSGTTKVFGFNAVKESNAIRKRSSLLPQEASCVEMLTARENILYHGGIHSGDTISKKELERRVDNLIKLINLEDRQNDLTKSFSGGMKRRVLVACTLVMDPELIFLDEPTTAIDIIGAKIIRSLIRKLSNEENKTIFLTTHDLTDINELCDRVAIIVEGKLMAVGKPEELERKFQVDGIDNVYTNLVNRVKINKFVAA